MKLLQDLVSTQAERTPEATALVMGTRALTYQELEDSSNRLANLLLKTGVRHEDRVALSVPKCPEAIVGMLGVLKAGGIYVPIDVRSPSPRVARVMDTCRPRVTLLSSGATSMYRDAIATLPSDLAPTVILVDGHRQDGEGQARSDPATPRFGVAEIAASPADRPAQQITDTDAAHILFTSGSTGAPKGIIITHRNVVGFVEWAVGYFGIASNDRNSGHPPLHFDLSTFDIYATLMTGGELHMVPTELNLLPQKLAAFIRDSKLTQWFSVPSALTFMAKYNVVQQDDFPELKRILWCGEVLPTPTLCALDEATSSCDIHKFVRPHRGDYRQQLLHRPGHSGERARAHSNRHCLRWGEPVCARRTVAPR